MQAHPPLPQRRRALARRGGLLPLQVETPTTHHGHGDDNEEEEEQEGRGSSIVVAAHSRLMVAGVFVVSRSGSADGKIVVWRLDTLTYYRSFKDADQGIQVRGPREEESPGGCRHVTDETVCCVLCGGGV